MRLLGYRFAVLGAVALTACGGTSEPGTAGTPARIIVTGDQQTGVAGKALGERVVVRVVDASFRALAGVNVTFDVQGGGSLGSASVATDDSGFVHKTWTLGTNVNAPQFITVRTTGGSPVTAIVNATARADVPAKLRVVTAPVSAQNGIVLAQPPVVAVTDQYGNDTQTSGVTITASVAQATLRGTATATTDAAGRATFPGLSIVGKNGATTITFASNQGSASLTLTLVSGTAKSLEAVSAVSVTGEPTSVSQPIRVRVVDEAGNPVPGAPVTFNFVALLTIVNTTSDANGVATFFQWSFPNKAGTYVVIVSLEGAPDFSFQVISRIGPPAKVVPVDVPASIQVAESAVISARVVDGSGNAIAGAAVTFTPPNGGGIVSPRSTVADEDGVVSTRLTMPRTAGITRTQVALGGGVTQDLVITATAAPPARVVATPATNTVSTGTPFAVRALAYDIYDNLVPAALLTASTALNPGTGFVTPTSGTTDAGGGVTFTITGAAVAATQTFTISATTGVATTVVANTTGASLPGIYAYPAQETVAGGATHVFSCSVLAFKADGSGTQGVPITFSLEAGQGTVNDVGTTYSTATDVNGIASATWTLPARGTFTMKVSSSVPNLFSNPTSCQATAF